MKLAKRSGASVSWRPRRMSVQTAFWTRNDGSELIENGYFQSKNTLGLPPGEPRSSAAVRRGLARTGRSGRSLAGLYVLFGAHSCFLAPDRVLRAYAVGWLCKNVHFCRRLSQGAGAQRGGRSSGARTGRHRRFLERFAVENGNRSGGRGSGRPRRMSLKTTLFRRNDGSAAFEIE